MRGHQVSVEYLYHYRCSVCNHWWSIADVKLMDAACPRCGAWDHVEDLD